MLAIPALDLRDGHVVQLIGGDYAHESIRLERPRDVAREWSHYGFHRLHVVDLDAATARGCRAHAALVRAASGGGRPGTTAWC
mgnify:CR=1 FL=1